MPEINEYSGLKRVETNVIKCKSCGGTMVFDPATQSLKCEHCGNTEKIDKDQNVLERDIEEGFQKAVRLKRGEQVAYKCHNCGAVVALNADESASICPFCSTSNIVKEEVFEGLKPQVVVPFKFGGATASEYAKKWAQRKIFAPRSFKKNLVAENMHGVYEPCFTFDSQTNSIYQGRVGDRHTRTVGSGKNRRTETYIVYRNVSGNYNRFFDDVLIANNSNFDQQKLSSLEPFDLNSQCVYEKEYLSGFVSEVYQRDVKDSWGSAKDIMDGRLRREITSTLNCDVVDYLNVSTRHSSVTYKYLLLPIYYAVYRFHEKDYRIMINGSNGKTRGKTPISPLRVAIAVILGLAFFALLVYLFQFAD